MSIRAMLLALGIVAAATPTQAQTIVTPIVSTNFNTAPGFIDLDDASSANHVGFGVAVTRFTTDWLAVEGSVMVTPSMFSRGDLVESSRLLSATGSVLVAGPELRRIRPYASIGVGVARLESDDVAHLFKIESSRLAASVGAGAWMWFTPRVGLRTSIQLLRTIRDVDSAPFETLQFSVGIPIRF